jgi:hypothetical protein
VTAWEIEGGWFDLPPEERQRRYAQRRQRVAELMVDVRLHRAHRCDGFPLCPGADAADKLNSVPPSDWGDVMVTLLASLAERDEEIENLRAEVSLKQAALTQAGNEIKAAKRDAEAGWEAYRKERALFSEEDAS